MDIQTVMLNGTPEEVADYAKRMMRTLGSEKGGFIGKYYPQPDAAGHTQANNKAAFDAFVRHGRRTRLGG